MTHATIVASELNQMGFKTLVTETNDSAVAVSLTSRKISKMEVETALDQVFQEINFNCISRPYGILVSW